MPLPADIPNTADLVAASGHSFRQRLVLWFAASWGACAFLPIGVVYLQLLLMLLALAVSANLGARVQYLRASSVFWPLVAMVSWTLVVLAVRPWFDDTPTRVFHILRVTVVLAIGIMLTPAEARAAFCGFVIGTAVAALVVAAHHIWGLPAWRIWSSLLVSRNNFSSGNMISMAAASGICFVVAISSPFRARWRWLALALALGLTYTVAMHAVSRNALLLPPVLLIAAVVWRFRSLRGTLAGITALLVLIVIVWELSPNAQGRFYGILTNYQEMKTSSNYSTSVGARWRMYQEAIQGMVEHPFFGTGLGSWLPHWRTVWSGLHQNMSPGPEHKTSEINNPHNDFLLAGMETGVMGMLVLIWLVGTFVYIGWKRRSTAGGVALVMGVTLFVTSLLNAPFRDAALGMTLLWLAGASVAGHRDTIDE